MRVLLVEDDPDIREALVDLLDGEGFDVVAAANGREALDRLDTMGRPCCVVTDLMMPEMDGYELMERLRAEPTLHQVPVVVVSALPTPKPRDAARFLRKPVRIGELVRELNLICRPSPELHAP